jgi:oligoendopeptidase F
LLRPWRVERWILQQDALLERNKLVAGLDPELVRKDSPSFPHGRERVRLHPAAIARDRELDPERLMQRVQTHESLTGAGAIVVHIHSRFLFEKYVYESREQRELSPSEMNEAMSKAQLEVFGDALDADATHPYMWCVSPHYYSTAYYNWPYTFGLLFGLGLYKFYEQDADAFRANYDELLSSTGMGDAAELCARFGIDVRTPDFWRSSLDVLRGQIDDFVSLVG